MADVEKFMSVDAGDIEKIMGVAVGDIETVMGLSIVTMQAYEGQTFLMTGGYMDVTRTKTNSIQKKSSTSTGNADDFGDSTDLITSQGSFGGGGRGIVAMGGNLGSSAADTNEISYVSFSTDGNAADTNDNSAHTHEGSCGAGNGVKGGRAGGYSTSIGYPNGYMEDMDRYVIAGGSDASDIGTLQYTTGYDVYNASTSTTWIMAGGFSPQSTNSYADDIHYMTWASEGNSTDSSNLTARRTHGRSTISNESVVIFAPSTSRVGDSSSTEYRLAQMDYVTPASLGDGASDYGDDVGDDGLAPGDTDAITRSPGGGVADGTRGEWWGGAPVSPNAGNYADSIRYVGLASLGDSVDAGNDGKGGREGHAGCAGT